MSAISDQVKLKRDRIEVSIDLINGAHVLQKICTKYKYSPLFFISPILLLRIDFFTILLELSVREQLRWRKLSFKEVVYILVPRYYPLGDYYVSIYCAG